MLNEVRRLEESAMRNDEELRQMALEQQQNQRHLVIFCNSKSTSPGNFLQFKKNLKPGPASTVVERPLRKISSEGAAVRSPLKEASFQTR